MNETLNSKTSGWHPASQDVQWNRFGFITVNAMPTTLTLKNIPDEIYEQLKTAAEMHRRSLNSEAIVCLETVLAPVRLNSSDRLLRARQIRSSLGTSKFSAQDIDLAKRQGRS